MVNFPIVGVTGSSGFLGQAVVSLLKSYGYKVVQISRSKGYQLEDTKTLEKLPKIDLMIHLASRIFVPDSLISPAVFMQSNITMTLNVLEACKKQKIPIVFASSYVYGNPEQLPITEAHPVRHWNPYASSKLICEELCKSYSENFDLPVRLMRIFNIFGPNQDSRFLVSKIVKGMKMGELKLENPNPRRDFVYVSDVALAIMKAVSNEWCGIGVYNVGTGKSFSVSEVVGVVAKLLGRKDNFVTYSNLIRRFEILDVVADVKHINSDLGWAPQISFKRGLELMIDEVEGRKAHK